MKKKIFALLTALCMTAAVLPAMLPAVFADGEEEPIECTCTTQCTEESKNETCPVCGVEGADLSQCTGIPPMTAGDGDGDGEEEPIQCSCTTQCTAESRNETCPVCGGEDADLSQCIGTPPMTAGDGEDEEEPIQCTCATQCTAESRNETCPVCGGEDADLSQCTGIPPMTAGTQEQCSCVVLCTEDNKNPNCPVCSAENADLSACKGEPVVPVLFGAPKAGDVTYIDEGGQTQTVAEENYTTVDTGTTTWDGGWYVVSGTVEIGQRVTVSGDVKLILTDGCNLTVNGGIGVTNSLTIYAQSTGSSMGELNATGAADCAGIGGGTIIINGGKITANGGYHAAGIGSTITISGGIVTATGGDLAAGIGGGYEGSGGKITISGGIVTATGGKSGAGIGNGYKGSDNEITISGGIVTATGVSYGAGIGSGMFGDVGTITIEGGVVTATGGSDGAAGIGGSNWYGKEGTFSTGTDGNAVIFATGGSGGSGIQDKDDTSGWSGVIFQGNEGKVYGNPAPTQDFTIPKDKTLTIDEGKTLTIPAGVTVTNEGTIINKGTLTGNVVGGGTVESVPQITTTSLPDGTVDMPYSQKLEANGNNIIWSIDSGSLPVGLTLENSTGVISGTPTAVGSSNFTVTATNNAGDASQTFTLKIKNTAMEITPKITTQPTSQIVTEGETATFTVQVNGNNLSYQWQQSTDNGSSWTVIADATDATYTTPATTMDMNGYEYRCVVSNSAGNDTSTAATLTVQQAGVPIPPQPTDPTTPETTAPTDTDHTVQTDNSGHAPVEDNTSLPSFWDLVTQRINATPRGGEITINMGARAVPDSVLNALRARKLTATFRYGDTELTLAPDQLPPEGTLTEWTLHELGNYVTEADESIRISEEKSEAENATATETTTPAADTGKPNPATGETTTTAVALLVAVVALTGLGVTLKRK